MLIVQNPIRAINRVLRRGKRVLSPKQVRTLRNKPKHELDRIYLDLCRTLKVAP